MKLITKWEEGLREQVVSPVFETEVDAIVVGGGTSGSIAAMVLAERGVKVLVLERLSALGGIHAHSVLGYYYGSRGGYYEGLDQAVRDSYALAWTPEPANHTYPEMRKHLIERCIVEHGGKIAYGATASGVYVEGRTICGVEYVQGGCLHTAKARIVIDATSEAYLSELAGCELMPARELGNVYQPYSNVAISYNRKTGTVNSNNMDAGYSNPYEPEILSRSIVDSGVNKACLWENYSADRLLLGITPHLGLREGKRVAGLETIRFSEWLDGKIWENPVFYSNSNVDNHTKDIAFEDDDQCDAAIGMSLWGMMFSLGVPMGALIAKDYDNLVLAGRLLSVDHTLAMHTRMNRDMQKCGEAAAVIATLAFKAGVAAKDVPYAEVRRELERTGCLSAENDIGITDIPPKGSGILPHDYPQTDEQAEALLRGDRPGFGILYAYRKRMTDRLREWMASGEERLRIHSAFALALLGDESAAPTLMELMLARDTRMPLSSRKYNALYGITAIYLLGKLRYRPALEPLMDIARAGDGLFAEPLAYDEFYEIREDYVFQFVSHSVRAVVRVAENHPDRARILSELQRIITDPGFHVKVTLKASNATEFDMSGRVKEFVANAISRA